MSERTKKRRGWKLGIASIGLLLVAGWCGWQFRPLNATERKLVGTWTVTREPLVLPDARTEFTLREDRVMLHFQPASGAPRQRVGTWSAADGKLSTVLDDNQPGGWFPILSRLKRWIHGWGRQTRNIHFEDDDRFQVSNPSHAPDLWIRAR